MGKPENETDNETVNKTENKTVNRTVKTLVMVLGSAALLAVGFQNCAAPLEGDTEASGNNNLSSSDDEKSPDSLNVGDNSPQQTTAGKVIVYRVANVVNGDHLFTINKGEYDILDQQNDWQGEGAPFALYSEGGNGRNPVYRCTNIAHGEHFMSLDAACEGGSKQEGLMGYVATLPNSIAAVAIHRCTSGEADKYYHLTTVNPQECYNAQMKLEAQLGFAIGN